MTKFLQTLFPIDANFVGRPLMERVSSRYTTRRNIPTGWEKNEIVHGKNLIVLGLESRRSYEIERIFTGVTAT